MCGKADLSFCLVAICGSRRANIMHVFLEQFEGGIARSVSEY